MTNFRFRDWKIYKDARRLRKEIFELSKKFPPEERFILTDQINRAATSILLQIAEGANRKTDKDMSLFLNRAHTSIDEVVACLDAALDSKYISKNQLEYFSDKFEVLAKQIQGFRKHLNKTIND